MARVIVVGGGMGGCAAAASAKRAGAEVTLVESTDTLGGLALFAGSYRINGQFVAHEEAIALGGGDIFEAMDAEALYPNMDTHGWHDMHWMYNCKSLAKRLDKTLCNLGIEIKYRSRVTNVRMAGDEIKAVKLGKGKEFDADVFIDATGTVGPMGICQKYGNGCVTCFMRCPTFGGRVSLAARAGVKEWIGLRSDGIPAPVSAACSFVKETLSSELQKELEEKGHVSLNIPKEIAESCNEKMKLVLYRKAPVNETLTIPLVYMGWVNMVGMPFITYEELRMIPGFRDACFAQPYTGWVGNSIRYAAVTPRDKSLKVEGVKNLFVAGEKIGGQPNGLIEAAATGVLAGHNAVRNAQGMPLLELPRDTVIGDFIAYTAEHQSELNVRHHFLTGSYLERMKKLGFYTFDISEIKRRVENAGLAGIFSKRLTS